VAVQDINPARISIGRLAGNQGERLGTKVSWRSSPGFWHRLPLILQQWPRCETTALHYSA